MIPEKFLEKCTGGTLNFKHAQYFTADDMFFFANSYHQHELNHTDPLPPKRELLSPGSYERKKMIENDWDY